ncbi:F-box/LRR-repeat protein 21-like isoform X1 [Dreissena polymorpha]|uniref:F-box/LRR-repeat protein 21-like isoform X1 n=1 Tax=Dreissena polymorpha TaxID=45954 RepID=UPI002263B859|nr:F-box/LRR-repeat protein 21-like isoform X1 [Dreissena polymorpha]XP_052240973.1 F-box/LRR-repeat protein 21-like isoform X1 [Dreissena polymorpha]
MADGTDVMADFSTLPDVVWVRILQYLLLRDRQEVASTCHLLHDAFNHPSLWRRQVLTFIGDKDNSSRKGIPVYPARHNMELTKQFGQYFQDLTIRVISHFRTMNSDLRELLVQVAENCRLESLTLDIGKQTSQFHKRYGFPPDPNAIATLETFVKTAFRMKHLAIMSWPMFKDKNESLFMALKSNEKLRDNLESMTLFWLDGAEWSEREPLLLSADDTVDLVRHFPYLTCLGLRSPMVNNGLLEMLAETSRAKLRTLKLVIHYLWQKRNFAVPQIEQKSWTALLNRNPDFRVEVTVFLATPTMELASMLTPEAPVSYFRFMKYSKLESSSLVKIYTQYSGTLTTFHSLCDSYEMDSELILLCEKCELLTDLIYHGEIYVNTVKCISKSRGRKWKRFELKDSSIKIHTEFDNIDNDLVLQRNEQGELIQLRFQRFLATDDEQLRTMREEVSSAIGEPWKPTITPSNYLPV